MVVGLEARGFLFSLMIAAELGIACVPIRKKGKLPGECVKYEYKLEYGTVWILLVDISKGNNLVMISSRTCSRSSRVAYYQVKKC